MLFKKNTKNKGSSCQISFQGLFAVLPLCSGYLAPSTVGPALSSGAVQVPMEGPGTPSGAKSVLHEPMVQGGASPLGPEHVWEEARGSSVFTLHTPEGRSGSLCLQ